MTLHEKDDSGVASEKLVWEKPDMLVIDAGKSTQGGFSPGDENFASRS